MSAPPNLSPSDAVELKRYDPEVLLEEYRLVQQKIDNIGGFKFRVRGWSITLISALLVAVLSDKAPLIALIGGALIICAFSYLEQQQDELTKALGNRAVLLERAIHRLTISPSTTPGAHPSTPEHVRERLLTHRTLERLQSAPRIGQEMRAAASRRAWPRLKTALRYKQNGFYYVQFGLLLLALVHPAVTGVRSLKGKPMEEQAVLSTIHEDALVITSQIIDGELDGLDDSWAVLASSLLSFELPAWDRSQLSKNASIPEILRSLPSRYNAQELADLCAEMLEESDPTSDDYLDREQLEKLEGMADDFEGLIGELVARIEKESRDGGKP